MVGFVDVFWVTTQGNPAEGADTATKQRANIGGHKTREIKGVVYPFVKGHLANIVAVVKGGYAELLEVEHGLHMNGHGGFGRGGYFVWGADLCLFPLGDSPAHGQVTVYGIVGRGLVGDCVWANTTF